MVRGRRLRLVIAQLMNAFCLSGSVAGKNSDKRRSIRKNGDWSQCSGSVIAPGQLAVNIYLM
jgi:hypothetical protein